MKYSKHGYKRNSKDRNNPYNIIPSGNITMKGVDFPVLGTDNLGNQKLMMPGANYTFPGNTVFEVPLAQLETGGSVPQWFKDSVYNIPIDQGYLPTVDVGPRADATKYYEERLPYYNYLSDEQKQHLNDVYLGEIPESPIFDNIIGQGREGYGIGNNPTYMESVHDFAGAFPTLAGKNLLETLTIPQATLVEGIEAARGNPYNFKNVFPSVDRNLFGKQRFPSTTFLQDAPLGWQIAGDIAIDPAAIFGLGKLGQLGVRSLNTAARNRKLATTLSSTMDDALTTPTNYNTISRPASIFDGVNPGFGQSDELVDDAYKAIGSSGKDKIYSTSQIGDLTVTNASKNLLTDMSNAANTGKFVDNSFPQIGLVNGKLNTPNKTQITKFDDALNTAFDYKGMEDGTNVALTRIIDSKGLAVENGKLTFKIAPHIQGSNEAIKIQRYDDIIKKRNTTHFAFSHVQGDEYHSPHFGGNWRDKSTAVINNINDLKKHGELLNISPSDTYFYTKNNMFVGDQAIVLTRDKKLYDNITKNAPKTNIYYVGKNVTDDQFAEIVNSFHRHAGSSQDQNRLFHNYIGNELVAGRDVGRFKASNKERYLKDFSSNNPSTFSGGPQGHDPTHGGTVLNKLEKAANFKNLKYIGPELKSNVNPSGKLPSRKGTRTDLIETYQYPYLINDISTPGNIAHQNTLLNKYIPYPEMKQSSKVYNDWLYQNSFENLSSYPLEVQINEIEKLASSGFDTKLLNTRKEWLALDNGFDTWTDMVAASKYSTMKRKGGELTKAQEGYEYLNNLPQLIVSDDIKRGKYDPHPLINTIYMNQDELDAGNVLPHEMYHWKQRNSGELFENPLLQSHPVGPVTAQSILNVYYNRRKHDQLREAQMMANAFGPDAQFIPNFIYDHSERYMYGNPNAAEGEAVMFESLYKDNKKYLEHEAEVLKNAIYKQDGGTTDSIPNVEVILNNPNISMPIDTILPTDNIMDIIAPNCDPGSACYDFFLNRRDAFLKGDTSNPTDSMVVDTVQPNLINFMPPPSVNKKRPEEMMKLKAGGALPKAQKGNEAIMIMGDAARLNEAGYDTKYSDLRNDQNLTSDQAELIGGFYPFLGEAIDAKNVLKSLYEGNLGDAALHSVGFMLPIVPGKAVKKGFDAGWDKVKGWWRGADNTPYQKMFDDRTIPVRGGVQFDDGIGEYNSLKSMHTLYPDNVVEPLDLIMDDGVAVGYNMRNIDGEDLLTWTKNNKFSQEMYDEIATVIDDLNSKGLYHGDLNAQNIMIDNSGNWRIIDPVGFEHSSKMSEELLEQIKGLDSKSLKDLERLIKKYGGSLPKLQLNKKYGAELPKAQTGFDMLQNHQVAAQLREKGIDPNAKGSDLNSFSGVSYMDTGKKMLSHGLDILSVPGNLMAEGFEGLGNYGDKTFNFSDAMPGFSGDLSFKNWHGKPMKNVANTIGIENPWLAFPVNLITDPSTWVGAGIAKNLVKKGLSKGPKIGVKSAPKIINPTFDDIMKLPDDEFRAITGAGKNYWNLVANKAPKYKQRLINTYNNMWQPSDKILDMVSNTRKELSSFYRSSDYKKRLMDDMKISSKEADEIIDDLIKEMDNATVRFNNDPLPMDGIALGSSGSPTGTVTFTDKMLKMSDDQMADLIRHEFGHVSLYGGNRGPAGKLIHALETPSVQSSTSKVWTKSDKGKQLLNYHNTPDEVRQRAINALAYMQKNNMSVDDFMNIHYDVVVNNVRSGKMSQDLLDLRQYFDPVEMTKYLNKAFSITAPIGIGTTMLPEKKYGGSLPKAQRGKGPGDLLHKRIVGKGYGIPPHRQKEDEVKGNTNDLFNLINNVFTHGKGILTKGLNQHIFDYVRPGVYPSDTKSILYELLYDDKEGYSGVKGSKNKYLGNIFKEDPFLDYEGNYNIDEEAYRMALGLDVENKWFEESAYRPSISNDPESKYYSSPVFNWDGLLNYINLNKYSNYDTKDINKLLGDRMNEMDLYVKDETGNLVPNKDIGPDAIGHLFAHADNPFEEHDSENVQWTHIVRDGEYWPHKALGKDGFDPYAKIKVSLAEDEKGTYLSYYDKYDFKNDYINQLIEAGGGNPVEFYDKKYVEFDNDGRLIFKKQGGSLLEIEDGKEITVDFNQLEKGIRYAESLNGELMKNPESSASGLYQQLFDEIEYDGTRDEFIADTDYQKELFRKRAHGEMENVPGLMDNGIEVYNEYKDQLDLNKHGLTPLTIAGLSNMLGRQGTRKYIGYVLRDGDPIEEIFPHLYGEFAEYKNHTPTEYIEKFNKGLLEKKEGGQINNKIKRLKQQLQLYKNGKEMSPLAERELIALGLIKPKMQTGGSYTVKRGDRLGRIASDNNMTLEELITLNPQFKDNPGEIYPGQKIYFNSEEKIIDNESKTNLMHVIKKGETLSEIATRYGLDYMEIAKLNNIKNPGMVRAGTSIKIPSTAKIDRNNEKIQKQEKIANSPYNDHNIIILNDDGIANQTWVKRAFVYDWDPNSPTYGQSVWKNIEGKRNIIKDINQKEEQVDRIVSGINNNYTGTYKENEYIVKPNDNLSTIAKNNNTSLSKLIKDNNITNKDHIQIGQKLKIIKSDAQPYLILDDKNGRLHVYYPGDEDPRYSYPVLTGAMEGDQQTQTKVAFYKDGEKLSTQQINEAVEKYDLNNVNELLNLPGYKSQVDWDMGNKITGAGIYEIDIVNEDGGMYDETGQGRTTPSFTFTNESGISVPMVIHGGTYSRRGFMQNIENLSPEETKVSNGCINGRCSDLKELYSLPGIGKGTQMYVLPEEKGNNFVYENGKINFYSSRDNQQIANAGYATQSGEFVAGGPGMNVTKEFHNYKPINITFDKSFYEKNSKRYDGSPQQEEYEFVTNTQPFLNSIVDNKKMMMEKLNIDGDLYNDLAMIAFGIYGYESGMGDINNSVENSVKFGTKAGGALYNKFSNITNQYLGLDLGSIGSQSSPDVQSKYDTYGQRSEDNSVGWTQIRWNERDESELEALRKVGITNQEQLMDPANSAKATIAILAKEYQNQISGPQKNSSSFDIFTELPKKYSPTGGDDYADMVNQYMQYIDLSETDIDDLDNNLIIKGEYTIDARDRSTKLTDAIDEIGGVEKKPGNSILGDIIDWSLNKTQEQKKADINNAVTNTVEGVKEWWNNVDLNPFWKLGGEFSLRNQHQFYNDYINGVYKNTKQEKNANKLFDKINRMYYNDSKKSGMHQLDVLRKAIGSQSVKQ